jgi:hypothetical protein
MANQRERNRAAEAHLIRHTVYLPRGAYPEGDKQIPLNTKTNTWGFLFLQLLFKLVIVAVEDGVVVVFVYKGRRRLVYRVLLWKSRLGVRVWAVMVFLSSMLWRRSSRLWHLRGLDILNRRDLLDSRCQSNQCLDRVVRSLSRSLLSSFLCLVAKCTRKKYTK